MYNFFSIYSPNPIAAQQRTVTTDKTTLRLVIECWGLGFRSQHRVIKYNNKPKREIMRRPTGMEQKIPKLCGIKWSSKLLLVFLTFFCLSLKFNMKKKNYSLLFVTTWTTRWHTFYPLLDTSLIYVHEICSKVQSASNNFCVTTSEYYEN